MNNLEFENMILGTNGKEESIMEQPVWEVRCWLEGLTKGEYLKVNKDGQAFMDADELFMEIIAYGDYESCKEYKNILIIVYKNGDRIKLEGVNKNVLEEARMDLEIERNKNATIEGYWAIMRLLKLIPQRYEECLYLDKKDNSLWFSAWRLGKITNIDDIEEDNDLEIGFNREIVIERIKGEPVRIRFEHGKDEETNKYDYIDYDVIVGY